MSTQCNFELNSSSGVYYSGEVVCGTVILNTAKDKNVRNICIVFLGEGKVKWSESHNTTNTDGSSSSSTTYYKSHIVYVNNATLVRGGSILPKGLHTYAFSINLPLECPTSCEGKFGHIRYSISLIVDRPYRFNNVFQKPLTVLQTVDLNLNSVFKIPVIAEEIGYTSCCLCSNGRLVYALRIPYGAYAPGQMVDYTLHIQNEAKTDTAGYTLVFSQKQTFIAHSPRRKERHRKNILVQQSFNDTCLRLSTCVFQGQFRIPSVPTSTIDPDAIIKIEYKLKVTIHLSGCHSNSVLKIPIFIGTIPIWGYLQRESPGVAPRAREVVATAHKIQNTGVDLPPSYKDFKPPSFEEATRSDSPFVDKDVDDSHLMVGFRPLYPMYS